MKRGKSHVGFSDTRRIDTAWISTWCSKKQGLTLVEEALPQPVSCDNVFRWSTGLLCALDDKNSSALPRESWRTVKGPVSAEVAAMGNQSGTEVSLCFMTLLKDGVGVDAVTRHPAPGTGGCGTCHGPVQHLRTSGESALQSVFAVWTAAANSVLRQWSLFGRGLFACLAAGEFMGIHATREGTWALYTRRWRRYGRVKRPTCGRWILVVLSAEKKVMAKVHGPVRGFHRNMSGQLSSVVPAAREHARGHLEYDWRWSGADRRYRIAWNSGARSHGPRDDKGHRAGTIALWRSQANELADEQAKKLSALHHRRQTVQPNHVAQWKFWAGWRSSLVGWVHAFLWCKGLERRGAKFAEAVPCAPCGRGSPRAAGTG